MRSVSAIWARAILATLWGAAASVEAQVAPVCESVIPHFYDSGDVGETSAPTGTVILHKGAPWIQLDLSGTHLAPNATLGLIGEEMTEVLTAASLGDSNGFSAVFDGDSVSLELFDASVAINRKYKV